MEERVRKLNDAPVRPEAKYVLYWSQMNRRAEYNQALGERRAAAVRDYLTSRGVDANRLQTVSYGEERPKHDNDREETRRLNRRAALVVRLQ